MLVAEMKKADGQQVFGSNTSRRGMDGWKSNTVIKTIRITKFGKLELDKPVGLKT
jgi:hypothetical protein